MTTPSSPDVVIGEMRPWSDRAEGSFPAGGPVLEQLVADLDVHGDVLVIGPTSDALVTQLAQRARRVDVLIRSTTDAELVRDAFASTHPDVVNVTVGDIAAYAAQQEGTFDLVLAVDGLDRAVTFESAPRPWSDVLADVRGLLSPGGRLVLSHPLALAPTVTLDARPATQRHGDDDFHPFDVDSRRPLDVTSLFAALEEAQLRAATSHLLFGPPAAPRLAWDAEGSSADSGFSVPLRAALGAQRASRVPLLASPEELTATYFRAGRPQDAADAVLVVACDAQDGRAHSSSGAHLVIAGDGVLVTARHDAAEREWDRTSVREFARGASSWPDAGASQPLERDTAQPSETFRYVTDVTTSDPTAVTARADIVPSRVADGPCVGDELRRLASLGDVPAFRELAGRVGDFLIAQPAAQHRVFDLDDLYLTPNGVSLGFSALTWVGGASSEESLAAAWFMFEDDLLGAHRRHPWPSWVMGESNVASWLEAAGASSEQPVLRRGRELADALASHRRVRTSGVPTLREALADAESARREAMELAGHVFGLERTIGFRDKQLKSRGDVIKKLRGGAVAAAPTPSVTGITRLARRTAQVRSLDELTAGVNRVARRAKRSLGK